jgi:hypothetical protein
MGSAKPKSQKPFFSYGEALFDVVFMIAGTFLLAWLNFPTYTWIIVAACVGFIAGARLLRRNQENKTTK